MIFVYLLSLPGPTIVAPPPDRSPYLEIRTHDALIFPQELEELILEHPEVSRKQSGSLGGLSRLSFRGSRSLQNRMSLDGLPLTTGFTGLQAWRLIEPALLSHLRVDPGGSESGLTPIGGHVSLQTNRGNSGPWLQMAGGSYQFQHLSLGYRSRQIQIGTSLSRDQGDFSYFDDRGTLFFKDDDQWVTRQNNARQRINSLFSWQRGPYRSQWFFARLSGGVPGPGHRQTRATAESIHLHRFSFSHRKPNRRLQFYVAQRLQNQVDPLGEWNFGTKNEENSEHDQIGISVHGRTSRQAHHLRWMLASQWNAFRGQNNPDQTGMIDGDLHWRHPIGMSFWLGAKFQQLEPIEVQSQQQWAISPGIAYSPPNRNLLFRLQSMARLPSLFELYGRSFFLQGNPNLHRESGLGFDSLWRFKQGRISLYARTMRDLIEWDQNAQFSSRPRHRSKAHILGLSVWAQHHGFQVGYRLQGTWAYDSDKDQSPHRLSGEPVHRLRFIWRQTWNTLSYGFRWQLHDGHFLDRANLRPVAPQFPLDLHLRYRLKKTSAFLSLQILNALDQRRHHVVLLPGERLVELALADQAGYPLPGRRWLIGIGNRP